MLKAALFGGIPADRVRALPTDDRAQTVAALVGESVEIALVPHTIAATTLGRLRPGDPVNLEIVVDLLSTDAVRVSPGDAVLIERWGGEGTLNGVVRRIEPYGQTKVSALGIEEQRVDVIIDLTMGEEAPRNLWASLDAVMSKPPRVVRIADARTLRLGPRLPDGMRALAKALHA